MAEALKQEKNANNEESINEMWLWKGKFLIDDIQTDAHTTGKRINDQRVDTPGKIIDGESKSERWMKKMEKA